MVNEEGEQRWQLDLSAAELAFEQAVVRREASSRVDTALTEEWAAVAIEVYGWKAKTYLAAVLCGLVARAADDRANPLSLQVGDDEGSHGYAAASLWKVILVQAQGRIDLRNLKDQPFNNSPFSGKRALSVDWENVAGTSRPFLERTVALMSKVAGMSRTEAANALAAFLRAVPAPARPHGLGGVRAETVDVRVFFRALKTFLLEDGDNGRRAQAMVAASLGLVHPDRVDTPRSVNDPSRSLAGDVRVVGESPDGRLAMYAEAKQKYVPSELLEQFADEVRSRDPHGVGAYAALVNERIVGSTRRNPPLPEWREVLEKTGVLMAIWDAPELMVRDAIVWSGLALDQAVARFAGLNLHYLQHVETDSRTLEEWKRLAGEAGVVFPPLDWHARA